MEIIRAAEAATLSNSGITSRQLLFPENSRSRRITVTRVTVAPGARNPPHRHASSEQVWIALRGKGQLLVDTAKREVWPRIEAAVSDLCGDLSGPLLAQLAAIEDGLAALPLDRRGRAAARRRR